MAEVAPGRESAPPRPPRRGYLDWLRGIAVLIMIESHLVDSWTGEPDRFTKTFEWAMVLGGFGAPLFLLLAGVSVSLSAASRASRTGDERAASAAVMRRGLEIFILAFVFRIQAWILGWASVRTLFRVDILNIMGPAIIAAAALWSVAGTVRGRSAIFLAATLAVAFVTPIVRVAPWLAPLPDAIEAYIRPAGPFNSFTLLPWGGFVFAGAWVGVLLAPLPPEGSSGNGWSKEARLNWAFGLGGVALAVAAYAASFLPSIYTSSEFWTTSPAFFLLRLGVLTMAIGLAYAWQQRPGTHRRWSPIQQLGRTSLFIYWIHVELVYGLISLPIHHALTLPQTWLALIAFSLLMLACSLGKDRFVARWRARRQRRTAGMPARAS